MSLPTATPAPLADSRPVDTVGAFVDHGHFTVTGAGHGPLKGMTFAAKDLFDVAGHPTGAGNPSWLATHPVPENTNPTIQRLLDAGATLVGKTLTDELAYSIHGDNAHYGTPINTAAPDRVTGGSSSGSAAAVTAQLCDFALGTDTGGSTRVPASYCGIWGLRTTHGLLPNKHMVPLAPGYDTTTWLAHDPAVFEAVGKVLLPQTADTRLSHVILGQDLLEQADPALQEAAQRVFAQLSAELATQEQCPVAPDGTTLEDLRKTYITASAYEAWQVHGQWISEHHPVFSPAIQGRWDMARATTAPAAEAALQAQAAFRQHIRNLIGNHGVVILPSASSVAPLRDASAADIDEVRARTFRITSVGGLSGLPQVSIPFLDKEGLPIGVSLLGPAGSDVALILLAIRVWRQLQSDK